jgi:type VI secretion system secreted protein VgrG
MSQSSSQSSGTSYVTVALSPDPGLDFAFDGMTATEQLGRPFRIDLDVSSATRKGDLMSLLGSAATVAINLPGGSSKRYFNGIVTRAVFAGMSAGAWRYRFELRPKIWLLSRIQDCRIYQNQTAWAIITSVLRDAGFTEFQDKRQNQSGEITLEYCVQYNETSLDFVTRLMEKYGIYYFFTHADGNHTLNLADDPNSHTALTKALPFHAQELDYRRVDDHVFEWSADLQLHSGAFTFRDYNFTTPAADLTAKSLQAGSHTYGSYEVYEYPGPYAVTGDGTKLASVRMQEIAARREVLSGASNARGLYAGCKFTLSGSPDESQNREYLVLATTITVRMAEGASDTRGELTDTFRCNFTAMPGTAPFRLDPATPWPVMRGPQTAKVVGESGQEITTDQYGRVKVQFYWDRLGTQDQNSSCWIRVAQIWAGAGWGGIYIPRIGQEVVVDFLDGNPDRPLITGCVYNATQTVPYALPDNATRSTIKTNSSTGGGGFNELRFEDKAGSEEVFFQAQKDYNTVVLNNETVKITQDTTTTVDKGNRSITVSQGNNSLTVSQGNNSVTVSQGNDSLTVSQGNHSITVSAGSSTITAGQSITLSVGSNSITIDTSGVTVSAAQIQFTAQSGLTANGGPSMTLQAGEININ